MRRLKRKCGPRRPFQVRAILLCLAISALPSLAAGEAAKRVVPGSEASAVVVFVARIVNRGEPALGSPRIHMYTPATLPHQTITGLEVESSPERLTDRWGSHVLDYHQEALAPGKVMTGRWTARAALRRFQWDLKSPQKSSAADLTANEREFYLRDTKDFVMNDPVVAEAAEQAARGRQDPLGILDGIFGMLMDRLTYDRDGKWDKVPQVLTSGKGSCSEYSYCFIALCRRHGIPARFVGGIIVRSNGPFLLDKVFHRYPQAFLPDAGWVDFDPTRTDRANNKRLYFGQTPGPMLLLCVGDGGEGSLTGSDYLESHAWEGGKASGLRQAWSFAPPEPAIEKQVGEFRKKLARATPAQKKGLVGEALRIGHPFVLPWLDDLLYAPATRVAAARACLKIGGQGELAAVINCLGRLPDEAGDRRIGAVLEKFTGEKFGGDRDKWNEWLKARSPRAPLPGDDPEKKP